MARGVTDSRHYENIADAIRDASFGSFEGPIPPSQMAGCIEEIGAVANQVGIQSEYDRFWSNAMESDDYNYRFSGSCWNDTTFKPNKDLKPTADAYNMFYYSGIGDLQGVLVECAVTLDLSECTGRVDNMFAYSYNLTTVPYLDLRNITTTYENTFGSMFNSCTSLHTIDGIHLRNDGNQKFANTFRNCPALENLTILGTLGQLGFDVTNCSKLTHDSLMSIVNALADKTGDTSTIWTVTLGQRNLEKLTDAEKAMATQKGWTLA